MKIEEQVFHKAFAFKAEGETLAGKFGGMLSVFGNVDSYGDVILPGAFTKCLSKNRTVPVLWQHDSHQPIGKFTELAENGKGLKVVGELLIDADPVAAKAYAHLKAETISGLSIGYKMVKFAANKTGGYDISEIDLWEGSIVTFPANRKAIVTDVKSIDAEVARALERALKNDLGLSNADAVSAVAIVKKHLREEGVAELLEADREEQRKALAEIIRRNTNTMKGM